MADDRTPFEDVLKRAFDANLQYWETVNRAASDYVEVMAKVWRDAPISWTPGTTKRSSRSPASPAREVEPRFMPALLLEGAAGTEARAVVMVRNDLDREAEAPVVPSVFRSPDGETRDLAVRAEPTRVRVGPGEQVAVTLAVDIPDDVAEGVGWRGEVNVPGLSERGVPVVVRRAAAEKKAATRKKTPTAAAKKKATAAKKKPAAAKKKES